MVDVAKLLDKYRRLVMYMCLRAVTYREACHLVQRGLGWGNELTHEELSILLAHVEVTCPST